MNTDLMGQGLVFYCPNCMHEMPRALPVEPLYTRDEVCALVPCLPRWLKRHQSDAFMSEPTYMLDPEKRKHRLFTARDVKNLRTRRLAQHSRTTNRVEATYV